MPRSKKRRRPKPPRQPSIVSSQVTSQSHPPATKPIRAKIFKWGGGFFSILVAVSGLLPLVQIPSVDSPTPLDSTEPYSIPVLIKNNSLLPIWGIDYSCVPKFKFVEGGGARGFGIVPPNPHKALLVPGQVMSARCDSLVSAPGDHFTSAQFELFLTYHHAVWPFAWTHHYAFVGAISKGQITRWLPE
jgi:hypothetical protein